MRAFTTNKFANPTFTGKIRGVYYPLGRSGIPFIHLSSGSVSAAGAISAITALPIAYPNAYCFFPANALATTIAAGWYYCTFSTTTAGTAFLNTYTSGLPTVPSSPTAVTDGKGSFTGDTSERAGPSFAVAANLLGPNGKMRFEFAVEANNTAGAKNFRVRYDGLSGTVFGQTTLTTALQADMTGRISNRGATNVQFGQSSGSTASSAILFSPAAATGAIDTTAATTLVFSLQKAVATDNAILHACEAEAFSDGL